MNSWRRNSGYSKWHALSLLPVLLLSACATTRDSGPKTPAPPGGIKEVIPQPVTRSKTVNPDSYVVLGKRYYVLDSDAGYRERGVASWYGSKFHGRNTSSGEVYDMYTPSAAHKTLPLPCYARVTNLDNGRSVIVRVNDRGPFVDNRLIDLSYAAAVKLDMIGNGTAFVEVQVVNESDWQSTGEEIGEVETLVPADAFYLQVGAFSDYGNATRTRNRLNQSGIPDVVIREDRFNGKPLYRVRIGPIASVEEFDTMMTRARALGITDAHLATD